MPTFGVGDKGLERAEELKFREISAMCFSSRTLMYVTTLATSAGQVKHCVYLNQRNAAVKCIKQAVWVNCIPNNVILPSASVSVNAISY